MQSEDGDLFLRRAVLPLLLQLLAEYFALSICKGNARGCALSFRAQHHAFGIPESGADGQNGLPQSTIGVLHGN